jgi:hypothetical protein
MGHSNASNCDSLILALAAAALLGFYLTCAAPTAEAASISTEGDNDCQPDGQPGGEATALSLGAPPLPSDTVSSGQHRHSFHSHPRKQNKSQPREPATETGSATEASQALLSRALQLAERSAQASEKQEQFQRKADDRARDPVVAGGCDNRVEFVPTTFWQEVCEGQVLPAGLHYRINLTTGKKEAKLLQ